MFYIFHPFPVLSYVATIHLQCCDRFLATISCATINDFMPPSDQKYQVDSDILQYKVDLLFRA